MQEECEHTSEEDRKYVFGMTELEHDASIICPIARNPAIAEMDLHAVGYITALQQTSSIKR